MNSLVSLLIGKIICPSLHLPALREGARLDAVIGFPTPESEYLIGYIRCLS